MNFWSDDLKKGLDFIPVSSVWVMAVWILCIELITGFCILWWYGRFFTRLLGVQ